MKLYMAYNHNATELMNRPGTLEEAQRECGDYTYATGNESYWTAVVDVDDAEYRGGDEP